MELFSYQYISGSMLEVGDIDRSWSIHILDDGRVIYDSELKSFEKSIRCGSVRRIYNACERCMERIKASPNWLYDGCDCDISDFVLFGNFRVSTVEDEFIWFTNIHSKYEDIAKELKKLCKLIEINLYMNGVFITFPLGNMGNPLYKAFADIAKLALGLYISIISINTKSKKRQEG